MNCSLWLELTPHCNLDCSFCYNPWRGTPKRSYPGRERLDWPPLVRKLGSVAQFEYVALSGGEPLLVPDLEAIVRELTGLGQTPIVTTNGRTATQRRLTTLADAGLAGLQVPLHSTRPDLHDALSGRPSWRPAMRCILLARRMSMPVALTFVATASNVSEFPRVVELALALGIRDVVFNEVHLQGQARGNLELQPPVGACVSALETTDRLAADIAIHVRPSSPDLRSAVRASRPARDAPWHRIAVDPDGNIKLCNQSAQTLGNVNGVTCDDLGRLLAALEAGHVSRYRDRVNNCACLADRLASTR